MGNIIDYTDYMGASDIMDHGWGGEEKLGRRNVCRYCEVLGVQRPRNPGLVEVFRLSPFPASIFIHEGEADDIRLITVKACPFCGWWQFEKQYYHHESTYTVFYVLRQAELKSFPADSPSVPVTSAISNIRRWPELIHTLNPTKSLLAN